MWGVFRQLALHTWINSGHCQNNTGEVGSQVSVHCHWPVGCSISMYLGMPCMHCNYTARRRTAESVLVQNKKSLLVPLIWTNAFVLRNKHGATHWLTNWKGMRQWAVWKRQTLLAVCASLMAYCAWTRPALVFPTTKENSEFPKRRYWNSSMTWSEIVPKGKRSNDSSVGAFQPTILS